MTDANLFDPFDLHGLKLPNRILMSAMTRTRATEDDVPTDLISEYLSRPGRVTNSPTEY
jgi:N-ethylmaleimide reductase